MFRKVLICSDGSEGALTAARMGAQVAQKFHSDVLLLHTYDLAVAAYPTFEAGVWQLPVMEEGMDSYAEEARLALEEHTGQILKDAGVNYETLLERGHPVETITRLAEQHKADLIVLGSRGLNNVESFLMGCTSEGVLHHAHCPVLIVRGGHAPQQAPELQRILLASDGSEGACQAAAVALQIAQKFAASLSVLNVLDASSLSYKLSPYLPADHETPDSCAEKLLAQITNNVSKDAIQAGVPRSFHQEKGTPAEIIVAFANRTDASLIVIGCRGMGTFKSLLLGSVSNRVAHHSPRSVLVTR
jgi:nucleotide-binding universal stress UspA family protein